uniref:Uncharacterized protein n=1 Tax=Rhizophora mucronata TaxID=61149 RepID=A0A2P2Q737_RHIMU
MHFILMFSFWLYDLVRMESYSGDFRTVLIFSIFTRSEQTLQNSLLLPPLLLVLHYFGVGVGGDCPSIEFEHANIANIDSRCLL